MKTVNIPAKACPVVDEVDVLVVAAARPASVRPSALRSAAHRSR